jgi:DivIVA domain-containing protein
MDKSDLDLPLLPSAEQIRRREFATVRRGFDPDQVTQYLQAIAEQIETLERELREARLAPPSAAREDAAPAEGDPYETFAKRFAGVLGAADREAAKITADAREEAERIRVEALAEADRIQMEAKGRAERDRREGNTVLAQAREEADRVLSSLTAKRRAMIASLEDMRDKLLTLAGDLKVAIEEDEEPLPTPDSSAGGSEQAERRRYDDLWVSTDTVELPDLALSEVEDEDGTEA